MKKKRRDEPNPGRRIFKRERMLLKLGTGNGERGTGNGERGTGNGERGKGVWEGVYRVIRIRIQNGGRRKRK